MFLKPGFLSKVDAIQTVELAAPVLSSPRIFLSDSRCEAGGKSLTAYKG